MAIRSSLSETLDGAVVMDIEGGVARGRRDRRSSMAFAWVRECLAGRRLVEERVDRMDRNFLCDEGYNQWVEV